MPHKVIVHHHSFHAIRQGDSNSEWQSFRHSYNHDGDGEQEELNGAVLVDVRCVVALVGYEPPGGTCEGRSIPPTQ